MAGAGSRFSNAGYVDPKPLIRIHGVPMIRWVIDNLKPSIKHKFIFICQQAHIVQYELTAKLKAWSPGCEIIGLDGLTDGAARTVLASRLLIDNDDQLMIANSDQFIDFSIDEYLEKIYADNLDGLIMTMTASDPKWSFVGLDSQSLVDRVVEKEVISNLATVGIYNFLKGKDFVRAADLMIASNLKVNGEYYVAPTYNQLIQRGARIGTYNIGEEASGMYGLGTPTDLEMFLKLDLSKNHFDIL